MFWNRIYFHALLGKITKITQKRSAPGAVQSWQVGTQAQILVNT